MADGRKLIPTTRLVLMAVVAGAFAGAVAVYVSAMLSGNNAARSAAESVVDADADSCAAKTDKAKTIAAAATGEVAAMMPADPPQSVRKLAFDGPDGKPATLGRQHGKVVLFNLWATWCAPCRAEMPALNALQKELGSDRFEVVAVNVDAGDETKPRKFLTETGVDALAFYRDGSMGVFNDLKKRGLALGLPVTLLIDGNGCILAHMNGPANWSGDDAKKLIAAALDG